MIKVYALIFKGKTKWQIVRDGLGALRIYSIEEKAKDNKSINNYNVIVIIVYWVIL